MNDKIKEILAGLFLSLFGYGGALFLYWHLTELEATGGSFRIKSIFALLYMIGGKWLLCLPFVLFGLFGTVYLTGRQTRLKTRQCK